MIGHLVAALVMQRLPVQNGRLRYLTRSLEQKKYKRLGARWNGGQCPRETRSISARTIRSTNPGRLSSSQDFSRGWSVSRTNSSSVCEFCFLTACASALNAESTAAVVCRDKSPTSSAGSDAVFFFGAGFGRSRRRLRRHWLVGRRMLWRYDGDFDQVRRRLSGVLIVALNIGESSIHRQFLPTSCCE